MKKKLLICVSMAMILLSQVLFCGCGPKGLISDNNQDSPQVSTVPYTKGVVENGYYKNEWANIQFKITDEWPEAKKEAYASAENAQTECGFLSSKMTGETFYIAFEDLSKTMAKITLSGYMEALKLQTTKEFPDTITYTVDESTTTIAGENYSVIKISCSNGAFAFLSARILDEKAVVICAICFDENQFQTLTSQITKIK